MEMPKTRECPKRCDIGSHGEFLKEITLIEKAWEDAVQGLRDLIIRRKLNGIVHGGMGPFPYSGFDLGIFVMGFSKPSLTLGIFHGSFSKRDLTLGNVLWKLDSAAPFFPGI